MRAIMLDTEGQWSEALASNNIRVIIHWLQRLTYEGEVEDILPTFSCWVQRTSEFAKKELLTLCFSHCQGLWMFLDRSSFTRVHMLLQRLRNLLTLAQWARRHFSSAHLWHGMGVPCVVCRDTFCSSDIRRGCWSRENRALKQHIWLGRLVQWWGIMGLLPKYPEAHEVKRISQMWKEMIHCQKTPGWEKGETGSFQSLIQGLVTQLDRQHRCIWISEDSTDQCYPPPNLQALLKLVLVPHIDNMSVQALLMYFVLDMTNFLQCKDDLLQSFCHAFTIPSNFSQQIRAFWMLDHGHIKASMELLLSPRAAAPWLSWQHRCIIRCLLMRKQPQLALRYLHWTRPTTENAEDAKLCADVLLQNSCVSEAWALLKRGHTESNDMVMHFLQACNGFGLCADALKYIPAGYNGQRDNVNESETTGSKLPLVNEGRPPCPLSATLYQAQRVSKVSPEELVQLVRTAVIEVRKPHPKISEVVWPEHAERKSNSREMCLLTRHLTPSPSPMDTVEETAHTDEAEEGQPVHQQPEWPESLSSSEDLSSGSVSSFTSASSLPLLRRDRPYVYESTLTLQRISSLLSDEGHQEENDEEEEEDSRTPSLIDVLPDFPQLPETLDGATGPISLGSLDTDAGEEHGLSAEEREEDLETNVFLSEDSVDAVSGRSMDKTPPLNKSAEDSQSVPDLCGLQVESHGFLSPDEEKLACSQRVSDDGTADVTDLWSSAVSLNQDDQPDCIPYESFNFTDGSTSACFLEGELHWKTYDQEKSVYFPCAMSEPTQDMLTDSHQSFLPEDAVASSSCASAGMVQWDISFLCPTQLQQLSAGSLTPNPTCNIKTTSAPSDTTAESSSKAQLKTDEPCVRSTSAWFDHCKTGSWWTQEVKNFGASSGRLYASEPGGAITPDNKRASLAVSQPYSYSPVTFMDITKQKGDGKQADKEEHAGRSSLGRCSQGAIRSGRARSRRGKQVKRA